MPKKLRLTVDFMAFKCRTLRVKFNDAHIHIVVLWVRKLQLPTFHINLWPS